MQRVEAATLLKLIPKGTPLCENDELLCSQSATALAPALAAYRDTQAAPSGARSEVLPGTTSIDETGGKLTFEMLLALATLQPDPELERHTVVGVLPLKGGDVLCLWAGAKASNWEAGDGVVLKRAVETFALRQ